MRRRKYCGPRRGCCFLEGRIDAGRHQSPHYGYTPDPPPPLARPRSALLHRTPVHRAYTFPFGNQIRAAAQSRRRWRLGKHKLTPGPSSLPSPPVFSRSARCRLANSSRISPRAWEERLPGTHATVEPNHHTVTLTLVFPRRGEDSTPCPPVAALARVS